MLFNSYEFLFAFLPLTLVVYFLITARHLELGIAWLVLASLFFYAWWNPIYLVLIVISMLFNYGIGEALSNAYRRGRRPDSDGGRMRAWLIGGVAANLVVLGYFKYAAFLAGTVGGVTGWSLDVGHIVLPLAISFFTFQQIAYLVDAYRGITQEYRFLHYALFVSFFPQLIAGPIVHHREMLPQFLQPENLKPQVANIVVGLSIFFIGLFKKTVLADGVAQYATPVFDAAEAGATLTFLEAWGGALAYTLQLYFDFSGYSDMAIGAARLFGIRLPLNFHSPYKATNIIEFWRRWHITLSRFLRDYLYIALGGNRKGPVRRYVNLGATMVLGGLWHGAGWTFVFWGALHGLYLMINHGWRALRAAWFPGRDRSTAWGRALAWAITFLAVVVSWVFFRAASFDAALAMLAGMFGRNGVALPVALVAQSGWLADWLREFGVGVYDGGGWRFVWTWAWIGGLLPLALIWPNTQQIMARVGPALADYAERDGDALAWGRGVLRRVVWRQTPLWAALMGATGALAVLSMTRVSEFLYFQF
ncbi:MAG: MBOAT family protein [Gammaproteobacteria bacterium]|nr:MBOAT family protein [Gammaproteobacteria bacterium]